MKKTLLLLCGLMCAFSAAAQKDSLKLDREMTFYRGDKRGEWVLQAGGYGITLGKPSKSSKPSEERRVRFGIGFSAIELGFSLLPSPDYSAYPGKEGFLDLRPGKSTHFGFRLIDLRIALNPKRTLFFRTGLHLMCDNYTFSQNITLIRDGSRIVPAPLDVHADKSKLLAAAVGIPLQLTYSPAKRLYISALVYGDVIYNSHTKYKSPKTKANLSGIEQLQCGLGASISYRGIGLYVRYGLTPLFQSGVGPKVHPLSVGLYLGR